MKPGKAGAAMELLLEAAPPAAGHWRGPSGTGTQSRSGTHMPQDPCETGSFPGLVL